MLDLSAVAPVDGRYGSQCIQFHVVRLRINCAISFRRRTFAAKINVKELERKIRVGAVSYLNTKPLLYGIQRSSIAKDVELIIDYPASIASMLLEDRIDV